MITLTIEVPDAPTRTIDGVDEYIALCKSWPGGRLEYGRGQTPEGAAHHAMKDMFRYLEKQEQKEERV